MESLKRTICLILFVLSFSCAFSQSNKEIVFVLQEKLDNEKDEVNEANTKRDLELQLLIPVVMYDISSKCILIESQHIAFESITYYIINEDGAVFQSCEISLPRNVVQSIPLLHLPSETYCSVLEIDGICFKGYFEY